MASEKPHAIKMRIYRDKRHARGICLDCPATMFKDSPHVYCFDCRVKRAAFEQNRRKKIARG